MCQGKGASDAPTGKVRSLTWVQMGPTLGRSLKKKNKKKSAGARAFR